jgi:hypothetical protein
MNTLNTLPQLAHPAALRASRLVLLSLTFGIAPSIFAASAPVAAAAAPASSPTRQAAPPKAKKATDLRTVHYRRRAQCVDDANAQGLQGDDQRLFVQRCMQQP